MLFNKAYIDYNSVIYHVHIPKSGGTTVRENLSQYFKDNQVLRILEPNYNHYYSNQINSFIDYKDKNKVKKWLKKFSLIKKTIYLKNFIKNSYNKNDNLIYRDFHLLSTKEKRDLRFISSIQERMTIPNILGKNYLKIMIIRDPISRIQSYYFQAKKKNKIKNNNNKSQDIRKPYMLAADKYDINDFIKYLYNERPFIVSNPNCICLSGTQDFLTAKKIIDSEFFLAAPIEKLDDFLQLINMKLFQDENKKKLKKYNLGMNNPKNFLISKELIEKIKLTNKADIDLKEHIELEFNNILND
jgi:hypothetical protein|tara:strand:+ start:1583 stop:2482 length:900 start_codon:yes stop_codon:yes gene_type:complete